jgi:hypothetical protein
LGGDSASVGQYRALFLRDGVKYVGVVGKDARLTEDIIDEHVVGGGSDASRYIFTANHEGKSLEYALEFVQFD